jgi:sialic acid synthase SpsE
MRKRSSVELFASLFVVKHIKAGEGFACKNINSIRHGNSWQVNLFDWP